MNVAIDERVLEIVHARRAELEKIVWAGVDRELHALIDAELERCGNGSSETAFSVATSAVATTTTKVCRGPCRRTLPASSFDKHRRVCRECRARQTREREHRRHVETAADAVPPRPAGGDHTG